MTWLRNNDRKCVAHSREVNTKENKNGTFIKSSLREQIDLQKSKTSFFSLSNAQRHATEQLYVHVTMYKSIHETKIIELETIH